MRYLLLATLLLMTALALAREKGGGGHGGHHGGGGPTTEVSTPSPSTPPAPNGNTNGEVGQGGGAPYGSQAFARTPGAYNNACQTWASDSRLWQALWNSCR